MPQMSPMWWFSLFFVFISTYIIFMVMVYHYKNYSMKPKEENIKTLKTTLNWKW